jgi:hypothetical protein
MTKGLGVAARTAKTAPVKGTRVASGRRAVAKLANGLKQLSDNYLMCRDVRHAWAVDKDFHVEPMATVGRRHVTAVRRELLCMRCPARRIEHYVSGKYGLDKVGQYYVYPSDYQIPGVPRGVKPQSIIQQEAYRRSLERAAGVAAGTRATADR